MIFWDKILTDLIGVVGWRQSTASGAVTVDATNLASSSGLYFQGGHSAVTVDNISKCQEDKTISAANLNTVLLNLTKDGIANVINFVFEKQDIFTHKLLYPNESDFSDTITDVTGFVGFEINVAKRSDIAIVLNRIILQFDGTQNVKILFYSTNSKTAITSKTIACTADTNINSALDWVCGHITAPGGRYYIGYLNSEFTAHAYDRTYSDSNIMNTFGACVFKPVYVTDHASETMFDINDVVYCDKSFGMNLDVTVCKDYSGLIINNKDRFAKAIQLATAVEALKMMTSSVRRNTEERMINVMNTKVIIDSPETANVYFLLESEMKKLRKEFGEPEIYTATLRE